MRQPRLLVIIGSGEMGPRMRRVHRAVVGRLAAGREASKPVTVAIVDTPYAFQDNAAALSDAAIDFFSRLRASASVASVRGDGDPVALETALARIRQADFVFSGPGSPSYAMRHWSTTPMRDVLAQKLESGGALVAASAAALCLGRLTVPVYEIYKAGLEPHWLAGLDVLTAIGLNAAVIPHWDNAEGAGFDTRYCWLGEKRLIELERQMPADAFILGVDEHTALLIDLDAGRATVHGRGAVTIRDRGSSRAIPAGEGVDLADLPPTDLPPATTEGPVLSPQAPDAVAELARRVVRLEQDAASVSARAELVEPLVGALLELRAQARAMAVFDVADAIRERLAALGIQVADAPDGTSTFSLRVPPVRG